MKAFFKPTKEKVIYAGICTLVPYVLAFIFNGLPDDSGRVLVYWELVWSPLLFASQFLPQYLYAGIQ
jgi:hypothetical protein